MFSEAYLPTVSDIGHVGYERNASIKASKGSSQTKTRATVERLGGVSADKRRHLPLIQRDLYLRDDWVWPPITVHRSKWNGNVALSDEDERRWEELTPKELEIIEVLATHGTEFTYRDVAETLVLGVRTIHRHIENIFAKLQIHNKVVLVRQARTRGMGRGN